MKTYKITITFEVDDNEFKEIEKEITSKGKEVIEKEFAIGFSDPDFKNVQCKVEEK